jgi:uncharacterized coiled-coil DUF342 family protein
VYCEFCVRINLSSDLSTDAYDIITEMEFIALITLAEQAAKVCDRLEECIHQLKAAHEEIDSVHREIQTFSDLMSMFHQALKRPELKNNAFVSTLHVRVVPNIIKGGRDTLGKVKVLMIAVKPLREDADAIFYQMWWARYQWTRHRERVSEIRLSFSSLQTQANMVLNLISLEREAMELQKILKSNGTLITSPEIQEELYGFSILIRRVLMLAGCSM